VAGIVFVNEPGSRYFPLENCFFHGRSLHSFATTYLRLMKYVFYHLLAGLALCCGICAQEVGDDQSLSTLDEYVETGMEMAGVRAPYYDADGNLKAELYGEQVKILEDGVADVTNIRIDVFEKGALFMTIFAPQCTTRVIDQGGEKVLSVASDGDVLVDMEQMTISGRGFRFTSESNRFDILSEARVLVTDTGRSLKGLEL
jgi:hypothetical protein